MYQLHFNKIYEKKRIHGEFSKSKLLDKVRCLSYYCIFLVRIKINTLRGKHVC